MFDNPRVVVSVCVSHPHHIGSLSSSPIDVKPANVSQFCVAMRIELAAAFGEERRGWGDRGEEMKIRRVCKILLLPRVYNTSTYT